MLTRIQIWTQARQFVRDFTGKAETECDAKIALLESLGELFAANSWRHVRAVIPRVRRGEQPPPDYR